MPSRPPARRPVAPEGAGPSASPRAARLHPAVLALALALAATLAACGPDADPSPAGPRFAVAARGLPFVAAAAGGRPEPLSRTWRLAAEPSAWTVEEPGRGTADGTGLHLFSLDAVALVGPADGRLDPELHDWLVVEALVEADAETLTVQWRGPDDDFGDDRRTAPIALAPPGSGVQRHAVPLASLRAVRGGRDASAGLAAFRLVFAGAPGSRPRVRVDALSIVSDLDAAGDGLLAETRAERNGEARAGHALRLPATMTAGFVPAARERLRLGLALAGCARPLGVTLRAAAGDLVDERRVELVPGADWLDVRLDLGRFAGRPTTLAIAADPLADDGSERAATLLVGGQLRLRPEDAPRPDLLLYVEDTLRADRLTIDGYAFETDAHLAALARDGTRFARVVAPSSWTRPSMSSLLTSLEPPTHGNTTHVRRVPESVVTLAEALAAEGWLTASFVTNYHTGAWSGLQQGFDQAREPTADDAGRLASTLTSALVTPSVEAFLAEHADERVFVWVHTLDPHEPYEPVEEDLAALEPTRARRPALSAPRVGDLGEDSLRYDAEIRHNDRMLARLDDALLRLGLRERTLLAFTSDHGEAFGEHGQTRHRKSLYQEELAVPLVLRGPGVPRGRTVDAWTSLLDLAPTLLGALGVAVPDGWQGRDLSPLLADAPRAAEPVPLLAHVVYDEPRGGHLEELAVLHDGRKLLAAVASDGTLVPRALFDLRADPSERDDLLGGDDPAARAAADALLDFARRRLAAGRAAAAAAEAAPMDPALREWMAQMGYLQDDER